MKTYCIRNDYIHKSNVPASDVHKGYWTPERVYASQFHQFQVYRFAQRVADSCRASSVLDIGCGPGTKLAMLYRENPERTYIGIDLPEAIEYCKRHNKFGRWYAEDFNSPESTSTDVQADVIICSDVIEHVSDPDLLLGYIKERLTPEGRLVLSTPEREVLNGSENVHAPNPYHVREWNREEIASYVSGAGFEVEYQELQHPVRFWPNRIFYREVLLRALRGLPLKYNQVLLLRHASAKSRSTGTAR